MIRAFLFAACLILGAAVEAHAQVSTCTVPYLLQNGTTADASQVMSNFNTLAGCINLLNTTSRGNSTPLYVNPTGSDGLNNCLVQTSPCLTIQQAINNIVGSTDMHAVRPTINLANGSYQGFLCSGPLVGGVGSNTVYPIQVIGNVGSPSSVTIADTSSNAAAIVALGGCNLQLSGMTVSSTNGAGLFPSYGATIGIVSNFVLGATAKGQLHAETGGSVIILGGFTISAGAPSSLEAVLGGKIIFNEVSSTVTITNTPNFPNGFAKAQDTGLIYIPSANITFSGSATGARYNILSNSVIETNNGSATYLPGNAAGIFSSGGRYLPLPAPTIGAFSGLGSTGTATVVAGSTDTSWTVQLSPSGTGIASTGTVPVNFASMFNNVSCAAPFLSPGTGGWQAGATSGGSGLSTATETANWSNAGVALTGGSTYFISGICSNG